MSLTFPSEVKVDVLKQVNPEFYADKLNLYNALYLGGDEVKKKGIIEKLLPARPIEKTQEGKDQYVRRKEGAHYINRAGKLISWFTAACFPQDPKIVTEPYSEYFDSLNTNADGLGTHFCTLSRKCLRETMLGHRAYWHVTFPDAGDEVSADDMEALSARLNIIPATVIDDWLIDKEGRLEWTRSHNVELVRDPANPLAQAKKERHTWTYHTNDRIAIYEFICDIGGQHDQNAVAKLMPDKQEHDFNQNPIFDVRADRDLWVMDRVADVVKALFRREAGVNWALDTQCYAIPVITGQSNKIPSISGSELLALQLDQGATLTFSAPAPTIFEPLFKDVERLSKDLFEVCQTMSISAETIPQAGRISSKTLESFREPMVTLLQSFAQPIKESAQRTLEAIAKYRGEEVEIVLDGFDSPADIDDEDVKDVVMGKEDNEKDGSDGDDDREGDERDRESVGDKNSGKKNRES